MLCLTPKVCLFWWLFSPSSSSSENVICNHNIKSSNFQVATPSGVLLLYWKCSSSGRFGLSGYVPCLLYTSHVLYYFSFRWGAVRFCFSFLLAKCLAHVFNVWWLGWEGMAAVPMLLHTTCFFGTPIIFLPARHGFPKLGPFFLLSLLRKDFLVRWTF